MEKIYTRLLQTVTHRLNFTVAKILIKKTPFAPSRVDEEVDWQFNRAGPCFAKRPKRRSMICDSPAMRNAIISSEAGTSRHRTVTAIETTGNYVKELVVGIWQNSRTGGMLGTGGKEAPGPGAPCRAACWRNRSTRAAAPYVVVRGGNSDKMFQSSDIGVSPGQGRLSEESMTADRG